MTKGRNMNSAVETISPEQATVWLNEQVRQRPLNRRHVQYLAREITDGRWRTTHQGIAFDVDGRLVDGQHRLHAIVEARCAVQMMVTRGMPPEACPPIDVGKPRTRAQQIGMLGEKHGALKAAICHVISGLTRESGFDLPLGPSEQLEILARFRSSIEAVCGRDPILTSRYKGVLALVHRQQPELFVRFSDGISTGVNLPAGDPRLALRNLLLVRRDDLPGGSGSGRAAFGVMARTVAAVAAFANGERLLRVDVSAARYVAFAKLCRLPFNSSIHKAMGGNIAPTNLWTVDETVTCS